MGKPRPWYLRKRLMLPIATLVLAIFVFWYSYVTSNDTRLIVYNETGETVRNIELFACGQRFSIPELANEESVRFDLEPRGEPGDATLAVLGTMKWNSAGNFVEPTGGYRVFFKLLPGGVVEVRSYRSWFQTQIMGKRPSGVLKTDL